MTAPFDYRRDVEIPDDLIARLCAGEKQEKVGGLFVHDFSAFFISD